MHKLIKNDATGTPKELAVKLGVCESQLYNILEDLKIKGFPIEYSKNLKRYVYTDDCELEIKYSIKLLTKDEEFDIEGGNIFSSIL